MDKKDLKAAVERSDAWYAKKKHDDIHERDVTKRYWMGDSIGPLDDFGHPIKDVFIDGATRQGPWAIMAPYSHKVYGVGIGQGRGQRYTRTRDKRWLKTGG